jgi:hypothetical protein
MPSVSGFAEFWHHNPPSFRRILPLTTSVNKLRAMIYPRQSAKVSMASELCVKCQHVFNDWLHMLQAIEGGEDFIEYQHWENVVCLQKSADDCILCAQFLHQFSSEDLTEALMIMSCISPELKLMVLSDKTPNDPTSNDFWRLSLYLPLKEGPALAEVSVAPAEDLGMHTYNSPFLYFANAAALL